MTNILSIFVCKDIFTMENGKKVRLIRVAKEFNVGLKTITDFLRSKGIEIDSSPNTSIDANIYTIIKNEFCKNKNKVEKVVHGNIAVSSLSTTCSIIAQHSSQMHIFDDDLLESSDQYIDDDYWYDRYTKATTDTSCQQSISNNHYATAVEPNSTMLRANRFYQLLLQNYRSQDSYTAKARQLRTILEHFFNEVIGAENLNFAEAIRVYLQRTTCPAILRDVTHLLRIRLNEIVHSIDDVVDRDKYVVFYAVAVQIIYRETQVRPDNDTLQILTNTDGPIGDLNDRQRDIVLCNDQIINVDAGPGTGKTRLIIYKLVHYINNAPIDNPEKIVALSFTNNAAREIDSRFYNFHNIASINRQYSWFCGTIHGYCLSMLKEFYQENFDVLIIDQQEFNDLIEEQGTTENDILKQYKVLSPEGILKLFLREIANNQDLRLWLQDKVTTIVVDESQDLNKVVYDILGHIIAIKPTLKLFFVGDPRQNIYGFREGSYLHLRDFLQNRKHTQRNLTQCYRCPGRVIESVNRFRFGDGIQNIPLVAENTGLDNAVEVRVFNNPTDEVRTITDLIQQRRAEGSCAILASSSYPLSPFLHLLNRIGIPFKAYGGRRELKNHIKVFNHFLRLISSQRDVPYSRRKLSGILLNNATLPKREFDVSELGLFIIDTRQQFINNRQQVLNDIRDFLCSRNFGNINDYSQLIETISTYNLIDEYLSDIAMNYEQFAQFYTNPYPECLTPNDTNPVIVSTIHSAKGMEWDNVFIIGATAYNFRPRDGQPNDITQKVYVAATRTIRRLYLSYPTHSDNGYLNQPLGLLQYFEQ